MAYDREQVGKALQKYRKNVGMTQEDVAEKIGVSQNFYARIESGASGMSIDTVYELCDAFHITPNDILMPTLQDRESDASSDMDMVRRMLENCTEKQRSAAIDILKAYLRAI